MVNIVVAKYNENIDWTQNIKHKITIYDKSENPVLGSIPLKNVGREGETFLYHIVNNYDNLDDVTVFLQANPFDHLQILSGWKAITSQMEIEKVVEKMNTEIDDCSDFASFYQVLHNAPNWTNGVNTSDACAKYYYESFSFFTISPGAQYIVPKKYILSRPLEFWKRLQQAMYNNEELNGYCQELLWYLAFNHRMSHEVGGHDYEKHQCLFVKGPSFDYSPYDYYTKK